MFAYYNDGIRERYTRFGAALELYPTSTSDPTAFPHCPIGVWALMKHTGDPHCTVQDVQRYLYNLFHVEELQPGLWEAYKFLISAIVVIEPEDDGPGADHISSEPKLDQRFTLMPGQDLLTEEQCAVIASRAFIEVLNKNLTLCMTFQCYASNPHFLVKTLLAALYAELTNPVHAFQFHILMASLSPQSSHSTMFTFPCIEITLIAMQQSEFLTMLMGTPDWKQRLTDEGFTFLNEVLVTSLELSSLPPDAREAYLCLVSRADVVRPPKKTRHQLAPRIKEEPTFTLSSVSVQVGVEDRIALPPKEALIMVSQGFIACIQKQWPELVSHPWYGKNLNVAMMHLWDEYHSSCFPLP